MLPSPFSAPAVFPERGGHLLSTEKADRWRFSAVLDGFSNEDAHDLRTLSSSRPGGACARQRTSEDAKELPLFGLSVAFHFNLPSQSFCHINCVIHQ